MATASGKEAVQNSMEVFLHPLVILSISDHHTRERLTVPVKGGRTRIIGVLLGTVTNGKIEVTNSFEASAVFDDATGKLVSVDPSFLRRRKESFEKVFPTAKVVGWYESGSDVDPNDAAIITPILSQYTETVMVMMLDNEAVFAEGTTEIPIKFFETEIKDDSLSFKSSPYHIVTIEAERIGVDHIAKTSKSEGTSELSVHVTGLQGAMKILLGRLENITEYLKRVKAGTEPYDPAIMRKIGLLRDLILTAQQPGFEKRFFVEYNDVMLLTYLSSLTQGLQDLNVMVDAHVVSRPQAMPLHKKEKGNRMKKPY